MEILQIASSLVVGVVSAAWILWLFALRREAEPGAELGLDIEFVGKQDGKWLIEVVAAITNRRRVRHEYEQFRATVRYLLPEDAIIDGPDKINYQIYCPRTIDGRINDQQRLFANATYIDPSLAFRHSYVTFIPAEATFVLAQLKLKFTHRDTWKPWKKVEGVKNSQRLFKVPAESSPQSTSTTALPMRGESPNSTAQQGGCAAG